MNGTKKSSVFLVYRTLFTKNSVIDKNETNLMGSFINRD